ncbi:uncharacterized protein [Choristoneura fumiferana]|uniref:uncharacterized protein n=1 Tax=Choristoneura fumiferana TaxID=7141 RepID=UPI003D15D644
MELWDVDPDAVVDELIRKYDNTSMPLPDLECQPHLLISKVRKHYMEYIIRLLSVNYENNQKLLNKNIYLPSAIWRCAKNIETSAAQACMVVQLYRQNIQNVIKELKNDTVKGKLNKKLYECLHKPPLNEKKTQTTVTRTSDCNCECTCNGKKKRRRISHSPSAGMNETHFNASFDKNINVEAESQKPVQLNFYDLQPQLSMGTLNGTTLAPTQASLYNVNSPKPSITVESYNDDLTEKLEKLFQSDPNDDDLFEGTLCPNEYLCNDNIKRNPLECPAGQVVTQVQDASNTVIEDHAAKIKSLDERVASIVGMLANATENQVPQAQIGTPTKQVADNQKPKRKSSKWVCEEYFLRVHLYELLDQIRESNRMQHMRIKELFLELFGEDSDDEGVMSPLEESPEFVISCKERIAPWVVDLLTPYYIKGRIRGKALFKALAKHLIRLIYQCSKYPNEYEVNSFVSDFLQNHKMIRCEADYKEFRIENL